MAQTTRPRRRAQNGIRADTSALRGAVTAHGEVPAGTSRVLLDRPLLTADQAGALLGGIPRFTVLQMARDGRLPCLRVGKHVRFCPAELEEWLTHRRVL